MIDLGYKGDPSTLTVHNIMDKILDLAKILEDQPPFPRFAIVPRTRECRRSIRSKKRRIRKKHLSQYCEWLDYGHLKKPAWILRCGSIGMIDRFTILKTEL